MTVKPVCEHSVTMAVSHVYSLVDLWNEYVAKADTISPEHLPSNHETMVFSKKNC